MFEYLKNKKKKPTFFLLSVILHIIIFSLLILIPDTREYPKEEITQVVIPEPLKKPIHYPKKKVKPIKKRKVFPKPKEKLIKKPKPKIAKPKPKNNFSLVKEKKKKSFLKQRKDKSIPKAQKPSPKIKKKIKRVPLKKARIKKRRWIVVPDKEPKGPVKGKDNLPPGTPGKGGNSLYKGLSKLKPKVKKKGFVIPYGGKNRFSFNLGEGIGGGSGWKNYGASVAFDTHGINLDPWIKEVIRKVKSNWIIPTAAKYGLKGYNAFYLVFEKDGSLGVFKIIIKSKVLSFNLSSANAIKGSVPFPPIPDYYPYKDVKARFLFYYNLYPQEN